MQLSVKSLLVATDLQLQQALYHLKEHLDEEVITRIKVLLEEIDKDSVSTDFLSVLTSDGEGVGFVGWLPDETKGVFTSIFVLPKSYKKISIINYRLNCYQYHQLEKISKSYPDASFELIVDSYDRKEIRSMQDRFHHSGWYGAGKYGDVMESIKDGKKNWTKFIWPVNEFHKCYGYLVEFLDQNIVKE